MNTRRLSLSLLLLVAAQTPTPAAHALVVGGGPARTDCLAAWQVTSADRTADGRGGYRVDCQDGDPSCDADGAVNGACAVGVSVCVEQAVPAGCKPSPVTAIRLNGRATRLGLALPALPSAGPACGPATITTLALRKGGRPSRPLELQLTATAGAKDRDRLSLRCVPNRGAGVCPANPAGGPRELSMIVGSEGTDLDNGWTGISHNFPVPANATLRMCLAGCDTTTNPACVEDEAASVTVSGRTFGAPLPLLAAGVPTCVVNRFDRPHLTGATANLSTGAFRGDLHLLSDVYITSPSQICPRCSAATVGAVGTCDSGRRQGQTCRTDSVLRVAQAIGTRDYSLSTDCLPAGNPTGTLTLTLPLTTDQASLAGPSACRAERDDGCGAGECNAECTGLACVARTADGRCLDVKGGVSQLCCSSDTSQACFPSSGIVRTGVATPASPAWPDTTYPKTADATLAATFCEAATGSATVDIVAGLPGPGALLLPVRQEWIQ